MNFHSEDGELKLGIIDYDGKLFVSRYDSAI
jgi:hypothetical protein